MNKKRKLEVEEQQESLPYKQYTTHNLLKFDEHDFESPIVNIQELNDHYLQVTQTTQYNEKPEFNIKQKWIISDVVKPIKIEGSGQFATVKIANLSDHCVAIKENKSKSNCDCLFMREAKFLSQFCHPNIVTFNGVKLMERIIVMEYLCGGSLFSHLKNFQLSSKAQKSVLIDVAKGMKYLHDQNVLHRDLTCSNILLTENMVAKISDFGLSRKKDDIDFSCLETRKHVMDRKKTVVCNVYGTYTHMPPETLITNGIEFTFKSDYYSFGMVIWETFARTSPCPKGICVDEYKKMVINTNYRPDMPSGCSKDWEMLIKECWSQDPLKRINFENCIEKIQTFI